MASNPHTVLGVPANASEDDIRAAYRRKAAQVHPDVQPVEKKAWAEAQMRELNTARDWLLDPARRSASSASNAPAATEGYTPTYSWNEPVFNPWAFRRLRQFMAAGGLMVLGVLCLALAIFSPTTLLTLTSLATRLISAILMLGLYITAPGVIAILVGFFLWAWRRQ
ncbi:MAG: J domain-containing protein [Anaerolineales bacterium]|nr:J domain-containing protein [Anaerolineales bacterium]